MPRPSYFYDIESSAQLFDLLKATAANFTAGRGKRTQDLLFLVFGLTHLREWIAPGYKPKVPPTTPEEHFFQSIYQLAEFRTLQGLCNRSKHMAPAAGAMGAPLYGANIDDWPEIDSITDFDRGPPIAYFVDGQDVEDVLRAVLAFYDQRWFSRTTNAGAAP